MSFVFSVWFFDFSVSISVGVFFHSSSDILANISSVHHWIAHGDGGNIFVLQQPRSQIYPSTTNQNRFIRLHDH